MDIHIAQPDDAEAILEIYAPFIINTAITFENEVPPISTFRERIINTLKQFPWLLIKDNNVVAGYAYATSHRQRAAYQWSVESSVYLNPDYHGKGYAKSLYDLLFAILSYQGYYNVYAGITLPNPASEIFHRKMNFVTVGTYQNIGFKLGNWWDVQWLAYQLQPYAANPEPPLAFDNIKDTPDVLALLRGH